MLQSISILVVEDDLAQVALLQAAFEEMEEAIRLFRVVDVDEALNFLSRSEPPKAVPTPDLVLVDLNLPRRSGYELLEFIQANPLLKHVPVVIFSTADDRRDREKSLSLGASAHIGKPLTLDGYEKFSGKWWQ